MFGNLRYKYAIKTQGPVRAHEPSARKNMITSKFIKTVLLFFFFLLSPATIILAQTDQATIDQLVKKLTDDRSSTREEAATSLGYTGDPRAIPALAKALKDPEKSVQDAAAEALEQIDHPDAQKALSSRY